MAIEGPVKAAQVGINDVGASVVGDEVGALVHEGKNGLRAPGADTQPSLGVMEHPAKLTHAPSNAIAGNNSPTQFTSEQTKSALG